MESSSPHVSSGYTSADDASADPVTSQVRSRHNFPAQTSDETVFARTGALTMRSGSGSNSPQLSASYGFRLRDNSADSDEAGEWPNNLLTGCALSAVQLDFIADERAHATGSPSSHHAPRPQHPHQLRRRVSREQLSPSATASARERTSPGLTGSPNGRLSPASRNDADSASRRAAAVVRPPPGFNFPPSGVKPANASAKPASPRRSDVTPAQDGASDTSRAFVDSFPNRMFGQLPQLGHLTPEVTSSQPARSSAAPAHPPTLERLAPKPSVAPRTLPQNSTPAFAPPPNDAAVTSSSPSDLATLLAELNLSKYLSVFEEQDVDLPVFLTLSDADLKEVGI